MKRSIEDSKKLIEKLMPLQKKKHSFPCPRCGIYRMHMDRPSLNALSRYANVYICEECGMDEALRDMAKNPLPLNEWAMIVGFDAAENKA